MAEEKKYFIRIPHALVEVSEDVYISYFRMKRRWSAQEERDTYNGLVSYDALDTDEMLGEEMVSDPDAPSVEDMAVNKLLHKKLRHCLSQLSENEQKMIDILYFEGLSERQAAERLGLPHMTLHCRKVSCLRKLKKLLEN